MFIIICKVCVWKAWCYWPCARTVHCGAENDIDRASSHDLSIKPWL